MTSETPEPMTQKKLWEDMDDITLAVTGIVLDHLKADIAEWLAANDEIR